MEHFRIDREAGFDPILPDMWLVGRDRLIRRWRHGSDSFFWRAEEDGLLRPVRRPGRRAVSYRWPEVFRFEGGLPPEGLEAAYRRDLLLPEEVAKVVSRGRDWVISAAKAGDLPSRRVGSKVRFVPDEVVRWLGSWA